MHGSYPKVVDSYSDMARGALHFMSNAKEYSYAVTPALGSSLNSLQLSFSVNTRWTPENGVFEVGVMSNPDDTTTFELIKRITLSKSGLTNYEIPLISVNLQGENNYIAFRHLSNDSESGYYYLDDVVIDSLPDCIFPVDIQTKTLSSARTVVAWSSVLGETQWNVKVSEAPLNIPATDIANQIGRASCRERVLRLV